MLACVRVAGIYGYDSNYHYSDASAPPPCMVLVSACGYDSDSDFKYY